MLSYVFVASHDPDQEQGSCEIFEHASELAHAGNLVTVYLMDDAVSAVRPEVGDYWLAPLLREGVRVFADPFALEEHGIGLEVRALGVVPAEIETMIDRWAA